MLDLILSAQLPIMVPGGVATLLQMAANAFVQVPFVGVPLAAFAQGVGYGDRYPVSKERRIVEIIMILTTVALFTTRTSFLARWFMRARRQPQTDFDPANGEWANQPRSWQEAMERHDEEQRRLIQELKTQVEALQPLH